MFILFIAMLVFASMKLEGCYNNIFSDKEELTPTKIVTDTNTEARYSERSKKDTIIRLIEKPVYYESKPSVIYQQHIDSNSINAKNKLDVMLGVERFRNGRLKVYAMNRDSMLLKEEWFDNVGSEFTAYSGTNKVVVKSARFHWTGLKVTTAYNFDPFNFKAGTPGAGFKSSVEFMNTLEAEVKAGVYLKRGFEINAELSYKLIK